MDPSDNEWTHGVTDENFKGYTGKSSNFDLVRTIVDLKTKHNRSESGDVLSDLTELEKHLRPVRIDIRPRA